VRYIKVTYVGFRAHVKIASRIVSYNGRRQQETWQVRGINPRLQHLAATLHKTLQPEMSSGNSMCKQAGHSSYAIAGIGLVVNRHDVQPQGNPTLYSS